jgi:hypothetical protein
MKPWLCMFVVLPLASSASAEPPAQVGEPAVAAEVPASIGHWTDAHPEATFALVAWTQKSPATARRFFWWDRSHPLRAEAFLRFLIEQPQAPVEAFDSAHPDWPAVRLVLQKVDRDALDGLVAWARAHPAAVQDLLGTTRGFAWVGFHPLHALWAETSEAPPEQ